MDIKELRAKFFAEMKKMSNEELIKELEDAGYVIRYDLEGHGVVNADGTPYIVPTLLNVSTQNENPTN